MAKGKVPLKIAISDYPHTAAILSGEIPIAGVTPEFIKVVPQIAAYRRMVRDVEFDLCELASSTYAIARAYGAPFTALPIFLSRRFHHSGLRIRPEAGISNPKDLEGKKVGVRAYSVTTAVWARGVFAEEYGLDLSKVTWVIDDEEHVSELILPPNVVWAPKGRSLGEMMTAGELDAGFEANAGIGRAGPPVAGWNASQGPAPEFPDLFPDAEPLEAAWFRKTGIYPIHGLIAVKENLLDEHPWLADSLNEAFGTAKSAWLSRLQSGEAHDPLDKKYRKLSRIVGDDPLPFGVSQNRPSIDALQRFCVDQKLMPKALPIGRLFFGA